MTNEPQENNVVVYIITETGQSLTKESEHHLLSVTYEKARPSDNVNAVVITSKELHDRELLRMQIENHKSLDTWEIIYIHGKVPGEEYPIAMLGTNEKAALVDRLTAGNGKSTDVIFQLLSESGDFRRIMKDSK